MEPPRDAFGAAVRDYHEIGTAHEIRERDDGYVDATDVELYFRPYEGWLPVECRAVDRAEGRVLDVGCGPGRHALHLQEAGHEVVGLDTSPGALSVAEERGLARTVRLDVADLTTYDGRVFETVTMLGNNFGLVGTAESAPSVLTAIAAVTTDDATILAGSMDPHLTEDPDHLAYHERNVDRGLLPGALRIRVRYGRAATSWFDYLLVSPAEMQSVLEGTDWVVREFIEGETPVYVGVLEKRSG